MVVVASMEVVGTPQDIPFPSLQVTGFEGCYAGDPQEFKEAAMCEAVEKQAGNLLSLKRVRYIRVCPQYPGPFAAWLMCKIVLSQSLPNPLSFCSPGQSINCPTWEGGSWKRTSHLKNSSSCE